MPPTAAEDKEKEEIKNHFTGDTSLRTDLLWRVNMIHMSVSCMQTHHHWVTYFVGIVGMTVASVVGMVLRMNQERQWAPIGHMTLGQEHRNSGRYSCGCCPSGDHGCNQEVGSHTERLVQSQVVADHSTMVFSPIPTSPPQCFGFYPLKIMESIF